MRHEQGLGTTYNGRLAAELYALAALQRPVMLRSYRSLLLAVACSVLLSACGVRYVYSQLDWIVPWQLRDYVSLESEQRDRFDAWLAERLEWHCTTQLSEYAALLRTLGSELEEGRLTQAALVGHADRAEVLWRQLMAGLVIDVPRVVSDLDGTQLDDIRGALEAKNDEVRETFLEGDAQARIERRVERTEKRLRRWFGRLDSEQRAALERWSAELADNTEAWWDHRLQSQHALLDWLERASKSVSDSDERSRLEVELGILLARPDARWHASYRESVRANRDRSLAAFIEVYELGDERQRQRVRGRLDSLASQFERLACN